MQHKVFIDGAEGTTGLRIHMRLSTRRDIELLTLPETQRKDLNARLAMIEEADVSVLCLPDAAAKEIAALAPAHAKICDASTAHRTLNTWQYGFPELARRREHIAKANRVAVPGCHATGFLALCAPLVEKDLLEASVPLSCFSLTGYSGGGKTMIAAYENEAKPVAYEAPRLYALGLQHKHLPEMQAIAGLAFPPLFSPIVDDYHSGMLVGLPLPLSLLKKPAKTGDLCHFYAQYYENEPLITVCTDSATPSDGTLHANELAGRDSLEIHVCQSETQVLLVARFDNLGKGACGAAIQCLNLMLDLPETQGLVL